MTRLFVRALGLATLAASLAAGQARADLMFSLQQNGPDVVLTLSGSVNTEVIRPFDQWSSEPQASIDPDAGQILLGGGSDLGNVYLLTSGPVFFGKGKEAIASGFTGDAINLRASELFIGLPPGYASGSPIAATLTFASQTLDTLGVRPGAYVWTLGFGDAVTDLVRLRAGDAAVPVPEPSSLVLAGMGGVGLVGVIRRRARV